MSVVSFLSEPTTDNMAARVFAFLLLFLSTFVAAQQCYYANGDFDELALECQPGLANSACCARGDVCLSNGLCQPGAAKAGSYGASFFAVSCKGMDSAACKAVRTCKGEGGFGVRDCTNGNFCCGDCDCNNSTALVSLGPYSTLTSLPLTPTSATSSTSTDSSSTDSSTTVNTAATTSAFATSSSGLAETRAGSTGASAATETDGAGQKNEVQSSPTNSTAIGAGVGVGVFVLIAGVAIGWWLARRNRNRKLNPHTRAAELPMNPNLGTAYRDNADAKVAPMSTHDIHSRILEAPSETSTYSSRMNAAELPAHNY